MNGRAWMAAWLLAPFGALAISAAPLRADDPSSPEHRSEEMPRPKTRPLSSQDARLAVAMLGDAYDLLLELTHETYHTQPNIPVAATVIRKLQARMTELGWPQARFLAVNAIVMHPDHVPQDDFEKQSVLALRRSNRRIEKVVEGQLRVATVVPLAGNCSSCHWATSA